MTTMIAHPVMNFYGFVRMPFDKDFEITEAFASPSLANAVAMLALGVESEDILLVSGPIGSGKSVALRSFIAALDPNRFMPIYLRGLGLWRTLHLSLVPWPRRAAFATLRSRSSRWQKSIALARLSPCRVPP